jgi:hypothetical protein
MGSGWLDPAGAGHTCFLPPSPFLTAEPSILAHCRLANLTIRISYLTF